LYLPCWTAAAVHGATLRARTLFNGASAWPLLNAATPFSAQPWLQLDTVRSLESLGCSAARRTKLPLLARPAALGLQLLVLSPTRLLSAILAGAASRTQIRARLLALRLFSLHSPGLLVCIASLTSRLWLQCLSCRRRGRSTLWLLPFPRLLSFLRLSCCLACAWLLCTPCCGAWRISAQATTFTSGQRPRPPRLGAGLDHIL
jgi:hypothetical protein